MFWKRRKDSKRTTTTSPKRAAVLALTPERLAEILSSWLVVDTPGYYICGDVEDADYGDLVPLPKAKLPRPGKLEVEAVAAREQLAARRAASPRSFLGAAKRMRNQDEGARELYVEKLRAAAYARRGDGILERARVQTEWAEAQLRDEYVGLEAGSGSPVLSQK